MTVGVWYAVVVLALAIAAALNAAFYAADGHALNLGLAVLSGLVCITTAINDAANRS